VAKWSPFRKIRLWALYDPAKRVIVMSSPYKKYLPEPGRRSGQVIVELTGFYPTSARDTGVKFNCIPELELDYTDGWDSIVVTPSLEHIDLGGNLIEVAAARELYEWLGKALPDDTAAEPKHG
jgi:hypothetical protein